MITNENVNEVQAEIARLQDRIRIWQDAKAENKYDKPRESGAGLPEMELQAKVDEGARR